MIKVDPQESVVWERRRLCVSEGGVLVATFVEAPDERMPLKPGSCEQQQPRRLERGPFSRFVL